MEYPLEQVDGLLPFKKVKPSATIKKKITDVHGSLKGTEVRKLIEQKEEEERKKEERKKERGEKKRKSRKGTYFSQSYILFDWPPKCRLH